MAVGAAPLSNSLLTSDSVAALRLAATRRFGPLSTLEILLALIDVDTHGDWEWVQLQATYVARVDTAAFADPLDGPGGVWEGVPLTPAATDALKRARILAEEYRLQPLPPGVLALGLVWARDSAATRALLSETEITHARLLELIQESVLGTTLDGLELTRRAGASARCDEDDQRQSATPLADRPTGWGPDWQLLDTPLTRRLDVWVKVAGTAQIVLLAALCLDFLTLVIVETGVRALLWGPAGLALIFSVGPPRRSPLTSLLRALAAAAIGSEELVAIAVLLFAVEALDYYVLTPRLYAAGRGGALLSAPETAQARAAGLRELRTSRAERLLGLAIPGIDEPPSGAPCEP